MQDLCDVIVIKKDIQHVETWRYTGRILHQNKEKVTLEAFFNRPDLPFHGILLKQGDRFIETFFNNRWYNIFTIYDRDTDQLKGWYCNITYPANISEGVVSYVDLALDLLVYPDGHQLELDQDEYESLKLPIKDQKCAEGSFQELKDLFSRALSQNKY